MLAGIDDRANDTDRVHVTSLLHAPSDVLGIGGAHLLTVGTIGLRRGGARLAQATGEDMMARCQQLFSLYSRHNTNAYAQPLEVDPALEDCRKGNSPPASRC